METPLNPHEARVLGCLIEKEATTPEYYPLSLNALVNACNQKSSREPVMELEEDEVQHTLKTLAEDYDDALATVLPRQPGRKEARWCHLLAGQPEIPAPGEHTLPPPSDTPPPHKAPEDTAQLKHRIEELEARLDDLTREFQKFRSQFD